MGDLLTTREERKDYARERPSKWLTVFNTPCVSHLRRGEVTAELSSLAGCKREHLVSECFIAFYNSWEFSGYGIPECDANGDLDWSIFAKVLDVKHLCAWWAVLARFLGIDAGLAVCLRVDGEWAGIGY